MTRRLVFAALVPLLGALVSRRGAAQVGSGGSGISPTVGTASLIVGSVTLRRDGQPPSRIGQDATLMQGDQLDTDDGSEAHVAFEDGGYIALRPSSSMRLDQYVVRGEFTDTATISLLKGALRSVTGWIGKLDPPRYSITASTATIGVRGTDHEVVIVPPQDAAPGVVAGVHDRVYDGATVLRSAGGVVDIARGRAGYVPGSGAPPVLHAVVPAFFNRLRSEHDKVVDMQSRTVRQRMEERLRARGQLDPNEHFDSFRRRQAVRQRQVGLDGRGRAPASPSTSPLAGSQPSGNSQDSQHARREARLRARQERQNQRRLQKKLHPGERKLSE